MGLTQRLQRGILESVKKYPNYFGFGREIAVPQVARHPKAPAPTG
jgi:hypothetical protein